MMSEVVSALVTGGIGAAIASIIIAIINTISKKGESRATAADLVTNAAGGLIDRLEKSNERLDKENKHLRKAILTLTDVVDDIIPYLSADGVVADADKMQQMRTKLRAANREARETL